MSAKITFSKKKDDFLLKRGVSRPMAACHKNTVSCIVSHASLTGILRVFVQCSANGVWRVFGEISRTSR